MKDTIDMARETKMPYDFVTGEPIYLEKLKAFEALVRADERALAAQPAPASWVEMVTANLVREGINKHKARELAEHFYGLAQRPFVELTDEDVKDLCGEASSFGTSSWIRHIEAKLRSKNT